MIASLTSAQFDPLPVGGGWERTPNSAFVYTSSTFEPTLRRSCSRPENATDLVRSQLRRVLGSKAFVRRPRLTALLSYLVEQHLEGRADTLDEYTLGVALFHRGPGFDPRKSSIIRVDMRRVREALRQYYATEGRFDSVVIEVPQRSYAISSRRR